MNDHGSSPTQLATPLASDPYLGQVIGDRYRILQRLGVGGMGAVYRAEHMLMRKTVALKLLHGELGGVDEAVRRFEREAQSTSRLSHPHIIGVTDFGRASSGELYLVMEYVPGRPLSDAISEAGRFPMARALATIRQILSALAHAHDQGIVHRDLKPANIMLTRSAPSSPAAPGTEDECVKILDFGIAKMMQTSAIEAGANEQSLTQAAMVFGTPSYMSPEQATAQEVDARADLYACGIILYELLTGRKPFIASDLVKVMAMQVTAPPPAFVDAAPDVRLPASLEAVVRKALEKDRTRRFQSAAEFLAAIEGLESSVVPQQFAAEAVTRARRGLVNLRAIARTLAAEVVALHGRLPWKFRRWTPIAGVLGVVALLVIVPSLCMRTSKLAAPPPPPKPVVPALQEPLQKVEDALARARLTEARMMLLHLLSKHPTEARVRYLLGNLEFVENKPTAALEAYAEALRLDPGMRGDAALLVNVRSLLTDRDKELAREALDLLITRVGAPATAEVVAIANEDRRADFRAAAREGCRVLACGDKLDLVKSHALDLAQARTCDEKREAVRALASTKDARAIEPLKKAKGVRGAFGGLLGGGNGCVRKDIETALKDLGG